MSTRYLPENLAFTASDLPFVCNRPLFCANSPTSVLAGDRPLLRLIRYGTLLGTLRLWLETDSGIRYLDEFSSIKFTYRANLAQWELRDPQCPGLIRISTGAPADTEGFAVHLEADAPVQVCWRFGGIHTFEESHWNLTCHDPEVIGYADTPAEWYAGNTVTCEEGLFTLKATNGSEGSGVMDINGASARTSTSDSTVFLRCSQSAAIDSSLHCVCGKLTLAPDADGWIAAGRTVPEEPQQAFLSALRRHEQLSNIFVSRTPDAYLDTDMASVSAEIDGAWYGQYTVHSNQSWNAPYLGWCNRFGNMLGGWIDRVVTEVEYYCGFINKTNDLRSGDGDPDLRYTEAGPNSRFYGIGHVDQHQFMYNMQTQFFDQAVFAWRMTNDPRLSKLLREALEYHTLWQDECFDSDNDGLYESYINTWPTDSVWYNGGGSCEETCYAYRAHQAALELAEAAGDTAAAERHRSRLALIMDGFKNKLWLKDAGYPAMYVEDGGHARAHRSAWLYNSFMPVDMDMVDEFEAAMCLDYPRWALENVCEPTCGKQLWISNWVPAIWSVRQKSDGENFQQAYACFKAGFAREGYELLTGALHAGGFGAPFDPADPEPFKPCSTASEGASLLARAVICGLHGYRPDMPNDRAVITPQYPQDWDHASLDTSYFHCSYRRSGDTVSYSFRMAQPVGHLELVFPLYADGITGLTGASSYSILPGFGGRKLCLTLTDTDSGEIRFTLVNPSAAVEALEFACAPGDTVAVALAGVTAVYDPQEILSAHSIIDTGASLQLRKDMDGEHTVFLKCGDGDETWWQIVHLQLSATAEELAHKARTAPDLTGSSYLPLEVKQLTDDVRTIFRQNYYTPRDHIHLSVGADGYSPWTFSHWKLSIPEIALDAAGTTVTDRDGAPYRIGSLSNNIAFTSLYPNWPDSVTVPVDRCARAVKALVCGSTNPMQIAIANAVLRFRYSDGSEETLELVNPDNFWSLCAYEGAPSEKGQGTVNDYSYEHDAFCLPETPPDTVELGHQCRAVSLTWQLAEGKKLESVTLETLSQEIVVGLMALTLVDPAE